jgi:Fur family ferric uptake transcriptional regulator
MPLPQTESPGRLLTLLAARGLRLTSQRRIIVGIIETADRHLDATMILRKAQKLDSGVNRVTVYRTLALLKKQGLIDELDLMHVQGERHFYERRTGRDHLHMTCIRCGQVAEFESALFEKLKREVSRRGRFQIVVSRLEIGGYCRKCSQ